jgi:pilus assembly protein CpaC
MRRALVFAIIFLGFGLGDTPSHARKIQRSKLTSNKTEVAADRQRLTLATGENRIVDLDFQVHPDFKTKGIQVGNEKMLDVVVVKLADDSQQLILKPLTAGETTVTVRDGDGNVRVLFDVVVAGTNLLRLTSQLRDLLKDIDGIDISIRGGRIFIDGEVLVPADYGRLFNILEGKNSPYADVVVNLTTLSPLALQLLAKRIQNDVAAFAPSVNTRVVNGQIWLQGSVENIQLYRRAERVADLYLPELKPANPLEKDPTAIRVPPRTVVQNFIVINAPPPRKQDKLIRVTVHFVELSKDYKKIFGFKWQPGFTADPQITIGSTDAGSTGATGASFTATISSLFPKLQSAQDAGFARILKTGTLLVRSGLKGDLRDETQIPFAITGPNGQVTTSAANVGLSVAVTPLILGDSDDIEMDLEMNQVNLIEGSSTAPITATHKVKTKIYVKSNESAAVAGVESADIRTKFNRDDPNPGNFRSPGGSASSGPLFTLLKSKNYSKTKSEVVMFVTPLIIESASSGTEDLKKNFRVKVR